SNVGAHGAIESLPLVAWNRLPVFRVGEDDAHRGPALPRGEPGSGQKTNRQLVRSVGDPGARPRPPICDRRLYRREIASRESELARVVLPTQQPIDPSIGSLVDKRK